MDTQLADWIKDTPDGKAAEAILRKCVHCGFCTATCPTYQILGDELDSPRGRIYLIKEALEGKPVSRKTQQHLDRCLSCRNCESTCPSGVKYGELVDIGRKIVDAHVARPMSEKLSRESLKLLMSNRLLFTTGMAVGKTMRQILPASIQKKIPEKRTILPFANTIHQRKVILLRGCVQPAMMPSIDNATSVILDTLGIQSMVIKKSGCCGAVKLHLGDQQGSLHQMKTNIDMWYALLLCGEAEALVMNASGCGLTVREYAHHFQNDPAYAEKARLVSSKTLDVGEFVAQQTPDKLANLARRVKAAIVEKRIPGHIAFHPPCTLQHGQQLKGVVEGLLTTLGFQLAHVPDSHLCCGSAGTYSILQPALSQELKKRKLGNLMAYNPQAVASANVGCLNHLESDATVKVRHWVEWVAPALTNYTYP